MSRERLGTFELLVLLAVMRLGDEAYGVPIAKAISLSLGRDVVIGSVYAALTRLNDKGLVSSWIGEPTAERGGRAKRYFNLTRAGQQEVRTTQKAIASLWDTTPHPGVAHG